MAPRPPRFTCPVSGCSFEASFGGYLVPLVQNMQDHVFTDHPDLLVLERRRNGGLVDAYFFSMMEEWQRKDAPVELAP